MFIIQPNLVPHRKLPNYIRSARKRTGLSQDDLTFLLGRKSGTMVSRYEMFRREPTLSTVFALEVVLGKPARELFAGIYESAEKQAAERARELLDRLTDRASDVRLSRKIALLSRLANGTSRLVQDVQDDPRQYE